MVLQSPLISELCLVLLPVDVLLSHDELFMELLDLLCELLVPLLHFLLLKLFGATSHRVHPAVRILRHLNFLIKSLLVSLD